MRREEPLLQLLVSRQGTAVDAVERDRAGAAARTGSRRRRGFAEAWPLAQGRHTFAIHSLRPSASRSNHCARAPQHVDCSVSCNSGCRLSRVGLASTENAEFERFTTAERRRDRRRVNGRRLIGRPLEKKAKLKLV